MPAVRFKKKSVFEKTSNSLSLSPLPPFPGKGGLLLGLPPLVQAWMPAVSHTKPLHDAVAQMADDLYGGSAPKQGCFGCLPKVLHDAKPAEQATLDTPFLIFTRGFSTACGQSGCLQFITALQR